MPQAGVHSSMRFTNLSVNQVCKTANEDILEYILTKLAARIAAKSRTFLVKVKTHRGGPLNEGADDLAEGFRAMEKEGENSR